MNLIDNVLKTKIIIIIQHVSKTIIIQISPITPIFYLESLFIFRADQFFSIIVIT